MAMNATFYGYLTGSKDPVQLGRREVADQTSARLWDKVPKGTDLVLYDDGTIVFIGGELFSFDQVCELMDDCELGWWMADNDVVDHVHLLHSSTHFVAVPSLEDHKKFGVWEVGCSKSLGSLGEEDLVADPPPIPKELAALLLL